MDAHVGALWVIAHTLATLDTIHGPRLTLIVLVRSNLDRVDSHLIILCRHVDGHTDGHFLIIAPVNFDMINGIRSVIIQNFLIAGLLHYNIESIIILLIRLYI